MKSILFKLNLKGQGVVNFDDEKQRFLYYDTKLSHLYHPYNNIKYAKKVLYKNENGELDNYKLIISSAALKKGLFNTDMVGQNTNFVLNEELSFSQLGSCYYQLNGYVIPNKSGLSLKKKSPITLCDAIQTCNAMSTIQTCTRSGAKDTTSDISDTSLFNEEKVGDIKYTAKGNINLNELQFVSTDDYYDRFAFSSDKFDIFKRYMKSELPLFDSKIKYYELNNKANSFPELGFKFSDNDITSLVKFYFKRLLSFRIERNNSYAAIESLEVKIVNDAIIDTYDNPNGWITITSLDDIDALNIVADNYYVESADQKIAIQKREELIKKAEIKTAAFYEKEVKAATKKVNDALKLKKKAEKVEKELAAKKK
jgi:hypothetical protein